MNRRSQVGLDLPVGPTDALRKRLAKKTPSLLRPAVVVAGGARQPGSCPEFAMGLAWCSWTETHCAGHDGIRRSP